MSDYQKIEKNAEEFYKKIKNVPCPKFHNEQITFNRNGFRHLIWKKNILRHRSERKRRLILLKSAPGIIADPNAKITRTQRGRATYWLFKKETPNETIKLIVRQFHDGKKHFYSIFSHKKTPPRD